MGGLTVQIVSLSNIVRVKKTTVLDMGLDAPKIPAVIK